MSPRRRKIKRERLQWKIVNRNLEHLSLLGHFRYRVLQPIAQAMAEKVDREIMGLMYHPPYDVRVGRNISTTN